MPRPITELPTSRERQVLSCLSHGLTMRQTADTLGIGFETVRHYAVMARLRLKAKNTPHAIAEAIRLHLIP